jgi:hypothetical protein
MRDTNYSTVPITLFQLTPALERVLAADNQLSAMKKEEARLRLENEQREEETKRLVKDKILQSHRRLVVFVISYMHEQKQMILNIRHL